MKKLMFLLLTFGSVAVSASNHDLIAEIIAASAQKGKVVEVNTVNNSEIILRLKDIADLEHGEVEAEFGKYTCADY